MFLILPVISWIFMFLIFSRREKCWRTGVLFTAIVWGVLVTEITEFLSLLQFLNFSGLFFSWLLTNFILGFLLFRVGKRTRNTAGYSNPKITIQPFYLLILICAFLITLTIGLIAITAPPNNWDSMVYHMPRVVHWIQNHSVGHYPTSYTPQLYNPPWGEFAIMHFQILSGGDSFANLIQWLGMIGSLIGVSLIAKQLGADLRGQIFSVVVCVTIPLGILHASNTNSTYVVAFWLVCFVYYVFLAIKIKLDFNYTLIIGTSLGLAILTKGTAYIYAFPFILWLIYIELKRSHIKIVNHILMIAAIVIFLNLGHYIRNYDLFGWPISTFPERLTNDVYSLPTFISNIIRNASLHMAIPLDIVNNNVIEIAIRQVHNILGVNINDPRITLYTDGVPIHKELFTIRGLSTFEDTASNPIHFWLSLFAIVLLLTNRSLRKNKYLVSYLITVLSSFLLFCLLLKWQPWHSRLHLPIFLLLSPFISIIFSRLSDYKLAKYLMIILIQTSLVWVLYGEPRTIIAAKNIFNTDRVEQYFSNRLDIKDESINAAKFIEQKGCKNIGLFLRPEAWEYPFWVLLNNNNNQNVRIEHVNVKNLSRVKSGVYPFKNFVPCAIISVGLVQSEDISIQEGIYVKAWHSGNSSDPIQVFTRQ